MIFENLPTTPTSEELLDKAFSRAARAGRAKGGYEAQESMLQTSSNILGDNLHNVVTAWPDFDSVDPFYYELADAVLRREFDDERGIDALRQHLSEISWAANKTHDLGREYIGKLPRGDTDAMRKVRKQGFARMGSVMEQIDDDLDAVGRARDALKGLPEIDPDAPTIVVAGYPNVGKSSFVNAVSSAKIETAEYPFTTKGIEVGHFDVERVRWQIVDTPGLLDRPADERNEIENQAVSALAHAGDVILFFLDASETCGYMLEDQRALRAEVADQFGDVPLVTVCNKADLSEDVAADCYMSVENGEGVQETLDAAVEAVGYEPTLPHEE
ncbi:probable GTP-binding protein [Halobacterium hubeiense]|uniref:Probable GTP-binding protein n=1 Tax=Halobacterium hubeiense TaxID=1407499 RepID=A0A0U5H2W8_9EURY|nr:NOG1 family protein [Halobacterium hubeiense]CQH45170.1 probable GTP-binding protein [Halobacterium hubeiense]